MLLAIMRILSKEVLEALVAAKILRIQYAPDSGSTAEAKLLKKNANLEKMMKSMSHSANLGLSICSNILIGYPGQKLSSLFHTALFCIKLSWIGVDDVLIHNFVPYSGSEFYENIKVDLNDDDRARGSGPSLGFVRSYSKNISSSFLSFFRLAMLGICLVLQYLFHPKRIFKSISNIYNKRPVSYFENLVYLKLFKENKIKQNLQQKEAIITDFLRKAS